MSLKQFFPLIHYWMKTYWTENGDPRLANYPFMGSFMPTLVTLFAYAICVLFIGPRWMQNRKPFSLRKIMIAYNLLVSLMNAIFFVGIMFYRELIIVTMLDVKFPEKYESSETNNFLINFNYLYFLSKYVDLLDTVFFVLRKKQSQVTLLHVYHHFSVPFFGWMFFRDNATMNIFVPFAVMNSLLHTLMYAYYGLSAFGPTVKPYLWWKRYITQMQIGQFIVLAFYSVYFFMYQKGYKAFFLYYYVTNVGLYLWLFVRFYLKTYRKQKYL